MDDYTHVGVLIGDARALRKYVQVRLIETRYHWVTTGGTRYRKSDGRRAKSLFVDHYHLDLSTVTPVHPAADPAPPAPGP